MPKIPNLRVEIRNWTVEHSLDHLHRGPVLQGGDLRARAQRLRIPGLADGVDAEPRDQGHAVRPDRRNLLARPGRQFNSIQIFG